MKEDLFKKYLNLQKYDKCIEMLQNEIIENIEKDIKAKNSSYIHTNIFDLIRICEHYSLDRYVEILKNLYNIVNGTLEDMVKISLLMELC